jgi:hypothetical protein
VLAPAPRPAYLVQLPKTPFFQISVGKNDPRIRILAGFPGSEWGKLSGEKCLDLMPFGGLWERCKSAVFWQTECEMGVFSTGTKKGDNLGVSGIGRYIWKEKGAQFGRILFSRRQYLKVRVLSDIAVD